jgi:hypothetical protein
MLIFRSWRPRTRRCIKAALMRSTIAQQVAISPAGAGVVPVALTY